jgi:hypothetical protein
MLGVDSLINLFNRLWDKDDSSQYYDMSWEDFLMLPEDKKGKYWEAKWKKEEMARQQKAFRVSNGSRLFLSSEILKKFDKIYDEVSKTGMYTYNENTFMAKSDLLLRYEGNENSGILSIWLPNTQDEMSRLIHYKYFEKNKIPSL